ncbi:MAG: polysaccharide deacetylase family protein [Armatimonadota bacterium]
MSGCRGEQAWSGRTCPRLVRRAAFAFVGLLLWPWALWAAHPTAVGAAALAPSGLAPAPVGPAGSGLREITQVLPAYAVLADSGGRVVMPGVHTVRRVTWDLRAQRPVSVELAVARPLLVPASPEERRPRIALTFDDGPSATYTPQILDIFAAHGARCTFLVVGSLVSGHRALLERAETEGHEVGIHSWRHASYTGMSDAAIRADLARCQAALDPILQRPVRWVRPPYGAVNARVRSAIAGAGYRVAMWSVDPRDWQRPGSSVVAERVLRGARDGAIVVLHDGGGNRAGTVAAMRTVVPALIERGFELVTLSELAGLAEPPPSERGMVLMIGDRSFVVENDFEDMRVRVDGVEVKLDTPPVRAEGQFLLHGRPVLEALGASVRWDAETLTVGFSALRGEFTVRLNTLQVTRDGEPLFVRVPSVYYHKLALLPVWLMANACGASVEVNEEARTIEFFTAPSALLGPGPPRPTALLALRGLDGMTVCGRPVDRWMHISLAVLGAHASVLI